MGDNYRSRTNVLLRPVFSSGLVKHAKEMGFRGVISLFLSIESWWRSSFNNWFFARMCWNPDFDVNDGMNEYCKKYYGRFAADINNIFSTIFTELHPESYLVQGIESYYIHNEEIKLISEKLLSQIDKILAENDDPVLKKRIIRLRTYVEFFRLFTDAFTRKKPADLETLIKYSSDHPEQYMVLMYPEYIRWRNENTFGYGR
jgi:hypothetical protein